MVHTRAGHHGDRVRDPWGRNHSDNHVHDHHHDRDHNQGRRRCTGAPAHQGGPDQLLG